MHCPFVMMQTLFFLSAIWTLFTLEEDRSLHVFLLHVGSQSIRSPVEETTHSANELRLAPMTTIHVDNQVLSRVETLSTEDTDESLTVSSFVVDQRQEPFKPHIAEGKTTDKLVVIDVRCSLMQCLKKSQLRRFLRTGFCLVRMLFLAVIDQDHQPHKGLVTHIAFETTQTISF